MKEIKINVCKLKGRRHREDCPFQVEESLGQRGGDRPAKGLTSESSDDFNERLRRTVS